MTGARSNGSKGTAMPSTVKVPTVHPLLPVPNAGKDKFDELKFAQKFLKKAAPLKMQGDEWFAYDGKAWRPTMRDRFSRMAMEILPPKHRLARHGKAVLDHIQMVLQLQGEERMESAVRMDDEGRVLLNVANGVLRVTDSKVELLPHSPDYGFTGCMAASWDAALAGTPQLFGRVVQEALAGMDDMMLLQWFAGYTLFPSCKEHEVFLICYGPSGTGKSTVADAIFAAFEDDVLVKHLSLSQICSSGPGSYSLPSLQTAMLNLGTELDAREMDESANFKQLVSGEPVVARTIYGRPFTMTTRCKLWFLSNSLPRFKSGTDAEMRRARFLSFAKKPDVKDGTLKERLKGERNHILTWMVEGLQAILAGIPAPMGSVESQSVLKKFELSNDPVGCFIRENCIVDPTVEATKESIFSAFREYLEAHQFPHKSQEYFFRALYERNSSVQVWRYRNRSPEYWLRGIKLKDSV